MIKSKTKAFCLMVRWRVSLIQKQSTSPLGELLLINIHQCLAGCLSTRRASVRHVVAGSVMLCLFLASATIALSCPFCSALAPTMSDDLRAATAAVITRCESVDADELGFRVGQLRVTVVMKGDPKLKKTLIEKVLLADAARDEQFWLVGYGESPVEWTAPMRLSAEAVAYLSDLKTVPESGVKRLEYFLPFLAHQDETIAADAYNEFALASLEDIAELKDKLDRQWSIEQLTDATVPVYRRRLCWTFLSFCGTQDDRRLFDQAIEIKQKDASFDPGMDAAISCLLSLGGEAALKRIERDYFDNNDADYLDTFAAISAIRVHGTELNLISQDRLAESLRHLLRRPKLADLVIPDLARWKDWSVIDRVAELFVEADDESRFVKPTVVLYLKACPLPAAAKTLHRLRRIDPEAVRQAEASMLFNQGVATAPVPPPKDMGTSGQGQSQRGSEKKGQEQ
ncbi:hypothetical protein [Roseiconus lacunae]|uniref:HEAT repeat domain-containing protein n=1 Tax=Roseiconus lacunae TaxID=2605694 RepID=A0ABT7PKB5_9BACT|nr:hypothetical protein [Roseiconus lacunae]MDM4016929.1 hypothetical protein [Roseiconus lacunae]